MLPQCCDETSKERQAVCECYRTLCVERVARRNMQQQTVLVHMLNV